MLYAYPGSFASRESAESERVSDEWAQELSTVKFVSASVLRHDMPNALTGLALRAVGILVSPRARQSAAPADRARASGALFQ